MKTCAVQVENGKQGENDEPSVGPVYRSILAKDGFPPPDSNMSTSWEVFRYQLFNSISLFLIMKNADQEQIIFSADMQQKSILKIKCLVGENLLMKRYLSKDLLFVLLELNWWSCCRLDIIYGKHTRKYTRKCWMLVQLCSSLVHKE